MNDPQIIQMDVSQLPSIASGTSDGVLTEHIRKLFREDLALLAATQENLESTHNQHRERREPVERLRTRLLQEIDSLNDRIAGLQYLVMQELTGAWSAADLETAKRQVDGILHDSHEALQLGISKIDELGKLAQKCEVEMGACINEETHEQQRLTALLSGSETEDYLEKLKFQTASIKTEYASRQRTVQQRYAKLTDEINYAQKRLPQLQIELSQAIARAEKRASATMIERLMHDLNPMHWQRSHADIVTELTTLTQTHRQDIKDRDSCSSEISKLVNELALELSSLPNIVREELITSALRTLDLKSTARKQSEERYASTASLFRSKDEELQLLRHSYQIEHQRLMQEHLANRLKNDQENLGKAKDELAQSEESLAKVDTSLQDMESELSRTLHSLLTRRTAISTRLADRAERARTHYDSDTGIATEYICLTNTASADQISCRSEKVASPICELPVVLQRRTETNFLGNAEICEDIALLTGSDPPPQELEQVFVDDFCDIAFGLDGERRPFFVTVLSINDNSTRTLLRPAQILPQLRARLPPGTSSCFLCEFVHTEKSNYNSELRIASVVRVPDTDPRPMEKAIQLARYTSRRDLAFTHPALPDLLASVNAGASELISDVRERAKDWIDYIEWAKNEIPRRADWICLGQGQWTNRGTWDGIAYVEAGRVTSIKRALKEPSPDCRIFELSNAGKKSIAPRQQARNGIPCKGLTISDIQDDSCVITPWPNDLPVVVHVEFRIDPNDLPHVERVIENGGLGIFFDTSGSFSQLSRQDDALGKLILRSRKSALSAAPYLMGSFFNVQLAAKNGSGIGGRLDSDIAERYSLNEGQRRAVEVMLATPEMAYIQGPPGTGKTTVIAAACSQFARLGKRVLISSQTNLAVENALQRMNRDPTIRSIWLNKHDGDLRRAQAVSEWYGSALRQVSVDILTPLSNIVESSAKMTRWISQAESLLKLSAESAQYLTAVRSEQHNALEAQNNVDAQREMHHQHQEMCAWSLMIRRFTLNEADWDGAYCTKSVTSAARQVLSKLATVMESEPPRLNVSDDALHRQLKQRLTILREHLFDPTQHPRAEAACAEVCALCSEIERVMAADAPPETTVAESLAKVRFATSAVNDALSRHSEIDEKIRSLLVDARMLLNDGSEFSTLHEGLERVRQQQEILAVREADTEPLASWKPFLEDWIQDLQAQSSEPPDERLGDRYLQAVNVVGITCNSNFKILEESGFTNFDVVIIDEVSKATPLELLRPMLLAPRAVLVGDHRQLPPTFEFQDHKPHQPYGGPSNQNTIDEDQSQQSDEELLKKFERLATGSLFRRGFSEIDPMLRAPLLTQYRMHPKIMSLVNRFYDGRLESGLVDPDGEHVRHRWSWRIHGLTLTSSVGVTYLTPERHALWIDSSKDEAGRDWAEEIGAEGIGNRLEARLVAQILADIRGAMSRGPKKKVAIATFYNLQKRLIEREISQMLGTSPRELGIDVETVDRFQGKEADIVIVSMVRNPPQGRLGKRSNPAKFERINVAFSRARDLLVVVGARQTFAKFQVPISPVDGGPTQDKRIYGQIIDEILEDGGLWLSKDILGEAKHRHVEVRQ